MSIRNHSIIIKNETQAVSWKKQLTERKRYAMLSKLKKIGHVQSHVVFLFQNKQKHMAFFEEWRVLWKQTRWRQGTFFRF